MSLSIPISQLNSLNVVSSSDYIATVQSSSLTTFKTQLSSVANWISSSVDASSSFSSISSSFALSSSWANSSSAASSSHNLIYPNASTASYAISSSQAISSMIAITASFALNTITGSTSISSSWASQSIWATTASFASQSIWATTASFASRSLTATSASWASQSIWATSASFASKSISSSYASTTATASFAFGNVVKAFGTFYSINSPQNNFVPFSGSLNFISGTFLGNNYQNSGSGKNAMQCVPTAPQVIANVERYGDLYTWIFHMQTPMPTTNYTVIASSGGEQGQEWLQGTCFPSANRTTTAFSMSSYGNANWDDRSDEYNWITLMVLHP
jgi:hypothetical protein